MSKKIEDKSKIVGENGILSCPNCGLNNIETNNTEYKFKYGKGKDEIELSAQIPIRTCSSCKFSFRDFVADDICHEALCKHLGVMTPRQIKDLRESYKLSQAEFAEITKLGEATLSRWERGVVIQNEAYDNYLYLLRLPLMFERLRQRRNISEVKTQKIEFPKESFRNLKITPELIKRKNSFVLGCYKKAKEY